MFDLGVNINPCGKIANICEVRCKIARHVKVGVDSAIYIYDK